MTDIQEFAQVVAMISALLFALIWATKTKEDKDDASDV